jgi:hypothetical protein
MPRDLAQLGRAYGDFIRGVFERLCSDDGDTIAADDLAKLKAWHADKVASLETEFRAEGLTEDEISVWRAGYRDQFASRGGECGRDNVRDRG